MAETEKGTRLKRYVPLLVLIAVALSVAGAKQIAYGDGASFRTAMHDFMGIFLAVFAMLKLFDLPGFAKGFQRYDLLAQRSRPYALTYPFIELALALGYLSMWRPPIVYGVTIVVMGFGAIGVVTALKKGMSVNCACMGTSLNVPLSTVAIVEDVGMAVMAAAMLILA